LLLSPHSRAGSARVQAKRAAELDEMWSFIGAKARGRWFWHALDHHPGKVLAYVVGTRKDAVYRRHLPPEQHTVGKLSMQKIERKHLTLRTRLKRLARKTLCFSRSRLMHDLLIGLYMNRVEFGCPV
jgi:insertion element IS1 protein InsB